MLFCRRIPGVIYKHRHLALLIVIFTFVFIYLLFQWGFLCSNLEPWNHVHHLCVWVWDKPQRDAFEKLIKMVQRAPTLRYFDVNREFFVQCDASQYGQGLVLCSKCNQYKESLVVGDLCYPLCKEGRIRSFSCQTFHAGKETVFSAVKDENTRIVFKLARQLDRHSMSTVYWMDNGEKKYPTEAEFTKMIIDHISNRLNTSVSPDLAASLGQFNRAVMFHSSRDRHLEMQELWTLLQDNEYLLTSLYSGSDVFPRLLGSCGQYFALEYLDPAIDGHVMPFTAWCVLQACFGSVSCYH